MSFYHVEKRVDNFGWLFQVLRKANAAQGAVEVILDDGEVPQLFLASTSYQRNINGSSSLTDGDIDAAIWQRVHTTLTNMFTVIFEDVLHGHVFLKCSDRMTLLQQWKWILRDVNPHSSGVEYFGP